MTYSSSEPITCNATHARDFDYSIQVNRWLLKPIGAWPRFTEATRTERYLARLLNFACHALIILTVGPCVLFIIFEDASMEARIKAIGPMSHWLMGELNYCCMLTSNKEILRCISHVEHDWRAARKASDRQLMTRTARVGRFSAGIAAICMHLGIFSYNAINGLSRRTFRVGNESHFMYQLPCPFYTNLLDVRFSPANEIVFALQFLSGFIATSVTVGACGLAAVLAMHACGQFNVLMSKLDGLVERSGNEQVNLRRKLGLIVEHHLRTLSFVWYIEKVMHSICLVELIGCTFNMCLLEYYLITEKSKETVATYAIVYISMTFNIFIFCYVGEILTEQCKRVGEKVYTIEWYRLPYKTALDLIFIMSRSSLVIKITAGKLIGMSIGTFGNVFKTSFTYFNILRTVAT